MARQYKDLVAWQRSHQVTLAIYRQTRQFPTEERFGLTSQLRRAAYSVPANISEGSGRDTNKDYLRFLVIAISSLKETEYFLLLARDLGYLAGDQHDAVTETVNGTFGTLQGLIKSVRKELGIVGRFQAILVSALFITIGRLGLPVEA
jgi:four helix bundle protein